MEFKNYCIVVLGDVKGTKEEIGKISETEVKFIATDTLVMATFSSVATLSELKEYFKSFNRNFFMFELTKGTYGVNLNDEQVYNHLFGEYQKNGDVLADKLTTKLFQTINQQISGNTKNYNVGDIDEMTNFQRDELLDKLLDKGIDNWDNNDKKIIKRLRK